MPGDFSPKKITDHKIFKTNWRAKIAIAFSSLQGPLHSLVEKGFQDFFSCSLTETSLFQFFCQTKYKDIPINKNKIIQTGAKSQFGRLKDGFSNLAYQVPIAGAVKKEPITPANWHIKIEVISLKIFIFPMFFYSTKKSPSWRF